MPWLRALRVLVLVCAFAHASGLSDALTVACGDDCAERDCDAGCPPICPTCHCAPCPVAITAAGVAIALAAPPARVPAPPAATDAPSGPDPGEILRVPIVGAA